MEPVDLQFARVCGLRIHNAGLLKPALHALIKRAQLICIERIVQRPLRNLVPHFPEAREHAASHRLRWRIWGHQFRVLPLELSELMLERIQGLRRKGRFLTFVVSGPVARYRFTQLLCALLYVFRDGHP